MIRHFFLDKTNTIIEGDRNNYGLNPILSLGYGNGLMRGILYFDLKNIKDLVNDKTFSNLEKLTFTLKMTNCFSINGVPYEKKLIRGLETYGERACSCDVILFKLPCKFDEGRGFDFIEDFWVHDAKSTSTEGSSWFGPKTMLPWSDVFIQDYNPKKDIGGIYSKEKLSEEYVKFKNDEESIIIGEQHFDFGNENLSIDITKYVIECINNKNDINTGLCLAFSPYYENIKRDKMQCLDFFTDHTNTFFHPYIEANYSEYIKDDRINFIKSNKSKLYLYVYSDGELTNLDNIPSCTIEENSYEVKQASKGVYFAEISNETYDLVEDYVYYDKWSEIALNGVKQDDVELEFYVQPKQKRITIGSSASVKNNVVPSVYGINDLEDLTQHEIREVVVDFREKFTLDKRLLLTNCEYRLYVKDGESEITVIDFQPIEMANDINYFLIHTMDLIPNRYFIDIKAKTGRETLFFKDVLKFNIVSDITERYQ